MPGGGEWTSLVPGDPKRRVTVIILDHVFAPKNPSKHQVLTKRTYLISVVNQFKKFSYCGMYVPEATAKICPFNLISKIHPSNFHLGLRFTQCRPATFSTRMRLRYDGRRPATARPACRALSRVARHKHTCDSDVSERAGDAARATTSPCQKVSDHQANQLPPPTMLLEGVLYWGRGRAGHEQANGDPKHRTPARDCHHS